jgi:hypothetical protein
MIVGKIILVIVITTASVTGLVMLEMMKVLLRKPIEKLRNGNYNIGTNTVMMFEASPAGEIKDKVVVNAPDPSVAPDAYDDKGNLKDEYKDPDLMLGYAEWDRAYPNPHTKYDKIWIEGAKDMTVEEFIAAVNAKFDQAGLKVNGVNCPKVPIEVKPTDEDPSGVAISSRALWDESMASTKANLGRKWVDLLKELTTRSESYPLLCEPIDASSKLLYDGLSFTVVNDDFDFITIPKVVLKLGDFPFTPYLERGIKPVEPWL